MSVTVAVPNDLTVYFQSGGSEHFASKRIYQRGGNSIFSKRLGFALPYIHKLGSYASSRVSDVVKDTVSGVSKGESLGKSLSSGVKRAYVQTKEDIYRTLRGGGGRKAKRVPRNRKVEFADILSQ